LAYTVSDPQNPNNYPVYVVDQDLGHCLLSLDDSLYECTKENCTEEEKQKIEKANKNANSVEVWKMYFDGASSWEGPGAGVLFVAHDDEFIIPLSYIFQWDIDYTNNICEYEDLVLGLKAARKSKIENLRVYGDAELIVKQIRQ
jgi:hypothetical protein